MDLSLQNSLLAFVTKENEGMDEKNIYDISIYKYPRLEELGRRVTMRDLQYRVIKDSNFARVKFYMVDNIIFAVSDKQLRRYNIKEATPVIEKTHNLDENTDARSLTFSPRFEFLIVSLNDGVKLFDPETLTVFRSVETKYPVNCC